MSVFDFQLGGLTIADGLAVPRTSGLVAKLMRTFFSGGYSVQEGVFNGLLSSLYDTESIFLEPAAVAGLVGPYRLMTTDNGKGYIESSGLSDKMDQATHIAWATGGSMVPEKDRDAFLEESKAYSIN